MFFNASSVARNTIVSGVIADKIKTYKRPVKVDYDMDDFMDEIIDRVRREPALEQTLKFAKEVLIEG